MKSRALLALLAAALVVAAVALASRHSPGSIDDMTTSIDQLPGSLDAAPTTQGTAP